MGSSAKLKPLPIGLQTFSDIINGGYQYIDKTRIIYNLIKNPKGIYFFSRPRRFGKSLTLTTLEALFKNKRDLFKGLWIDSSDYKWQEYPVIRIDMSVPGKFSRAIFESDLSLILENKAKEENLELIKASPGAIFADLIQKLSKKYQKQIVVLIDEYDKAILDNLAKTDVAKECRELLREFYAILKAQDENLRFVFLTGVSRFSKLSIFSGLNSLSDISMDKEYADLCGYTQEEIDKDFADYIQVNGLSECSLPEALKAMIKNWYNGYRFSPDIETRVYNPFSTLLLFQNKSFKNYWFSTGTPKFLIDIIDEQKFDSFIELEAYSTRAQDLESFDFENFHLPSILYQTGYLTIKNSSNFFGETNLELSYPNKEVRQAFSESILNYLSHSIPEQGANTILKLTQALYTNQLELFFEILKSYLAGLPYDIQIPQEKYFQSLIFLICRLISEKVLAEVRSNKGRVDMLLETQTHIYIFEFKLNDSASSALKQIIKNKYSEPYINSGKKITQIGVDFSIQDRNIKDWKIN